MTRSRTLFAGLALVAGAGLAACSPPAEPTAEPTAPATAAAAVVPVETSTPEATPAAPGADTLEGAVWLLDTFGDAASPTAVAEGSEITASFGTDGKVTGHSGCNSYFGNYTATDGTLSVSDVGGTMMACEEPLMTQEQAYLAALQAAEAYTIADGVLTITGASTVLNYHAQAGGLAGTSWSVTGYNNGKEAVVSVLAGTELTIAFDEESASGNAGCNTYSGTYTLDGTKITFGPLATTRMMCSDPTGIMEQELGFMAALQTATDVMVEGGKLELRTTDGALAVSAIAASASTASPEPSSTP